RPFLRFRLCSSNTRNGEANCSSDRQESSSRRGEVSEPFSKRRRVMQPNARADRIIERVIFHTIQSNGPLRVVRGKESKATGDRARRRIQDGNFHHPATE